LSIKSLEFYLSRGNLSRHFSQTVAGHTGVRVRTRMMILFLNSIQRVNSDDIQKSATTYIKEAMRGPLRFRLCGCVYRIECGQHLRFFQVPTFVLILSFYQLT